ncbi:hypothetical protein QTH90_10895 [Variovorax sp. J2P1-59]|uniref:hypothetical protein n=1 Tax=Variovorax flavidus TaxID=3053501 RepID=UPI0025772197|nr:hypothetical protein [Variovorax sp. J2P1-59]MDM0074890.1 hypothetical protein [Variovorax sp. J2P1-59]
MNFNSFPKWAAATAIAAGALFVAASANAEVNWSVGINVPGVAVGVAEPAPIYYEPAPVYSRPAPIYYQPAPPVYYQRPPPPAYYAPAPVYYGPPAPYYDGRGERWRHRHHHGRDWDGRGDRD